MVRNTLGLASWSRIAGALFGPFVWRQIEALVAPASSTSANSLRDEADRKGIRLVSWNLLAPDFAHPQKYPWCPASCLSWPYREKLIVSKLKDIDADLVCLQEMQTDLWDDFLQQFSGVYDGILQNVTNNHPVTNAVLFRKDKFQVLREESRSRALILVLSTTEGNSSDKPLYLANVHLQAGMEDDETRVCQLRSLLKRLNTQASRENDLTPPSVVVVGDFNMLPTNPVNHWLSSTDRGNTQQHGSGRNMYDEGTGMQLDHLKFPMHGKHMELLPLTDVCKERPPVLETAGVSSHQGTHDVDEGFQHGKPIQMTYCGGSQLDYIWTNSGAAPKDHQDSESLHSIDVLKTMVFDEQAFQKNRQQWPSEEHPSDHLPVGFEFTW